MTWTYKMVQVPPTITVDARGERGTEAARYLEDLVNRQAERGWEFYRVDSIGVISEPGCLGFLTGHRRTDMTYHVVTFRRPFTDEELLDDSAEDEEGAGSAQGPSSVKQAAEVTRKAASVVGQVVGKAARRVVTGKVVAEGVCSCGRTIRSDVSNVGKRASCPACGKDLRLRRRELEA
jgi:hypothetical protein